MRHCAPDIVVDLCALIILVLSIQNELVDGESACTVLLVPFLLLFHVLMEDLIFAMEE